MSVKLSGRRILGKLLGMLAMLFIITGITAPFRAPSLQEAKWGLVVTLIAIGLFFGVCAARVMKPFRR